MGNVIAGLTMSLDGFIAGPNDGLDNPLGDEGGRLFEWYGSGDTTYVTPSGTMTVQVSAESAGMLELFFPSVGALICGRRTFDIARGWGGRHPLDAPVFIVTHSVPEEWAGTDAPFTFVTDGIERAVAQAKAVAGDRDVGVAAAKTTQACLRAGLLDGIHVDLVPLLLGRGVRWFEHFGPDPIPLECIRVVAAPNVTHIDYRVIH